MSASNATTDNGHLLVTLKGAFTSTSNVHNIELANRTTLELRRRASECLCAPSSRFHLSANGKQLRDCGPLDPNIKNGTIVYFTFRFGGNPCVSDHEKERKWQPQLGGHTDLCLCPERRQPPLYPIPTLSPHSFIRWWVNQDCYCLSQHTFNKKNIGVWSIDGDDCKATRLIASTNIYYAQATYDEPNEDAGGIGTCRVDIKAPTLIKKKRKRSSSNTLISPIWPLGDYELRLNHVDDPNDHFHILGFEGNRTSRTLYTQELVMRFIVAPTNLDGYKRILRALVWTLEAPLCDLVACYLATND
jgi:hypothetical protein